MYENSFERKKVTKHILISLLSYASWIGYSPSKCINSNLRLSFSVLCTVPSSICIVLYIWTPTKSIEECKNTVQKPIQIEIMVQWIQPLCLDQQAKLHETTSSDGCSSVSPAQTSRGSWNEKCWVGKHFQQAREAVEATCEAIALAEIALAEQEQCGKLRLWTQQLWCDTINLSRKTFTRLSQDSRFEKWLGEVRSFQITIFWISPLFLFLKGGSNRP